MRLSQNEIDNGKNLIQIMLSRTVSKAEEDIFTFAAGYGAGIADAKHDKRKLPTPKFFKFKRD